MNNTGVASMKQDRWIWAIHILNVAWIWQMLRIYHHSSGSKISFLGEPLLPMVLVAVCMAHVARWHSLFRTPVERTFVSSVELGKYMREVGECAYKRTPYLTAPLANDLVIAAEATRLLGISGSVRIISAHDAFLLLLRTPRFIGIMAVAAVLAVAFLFGSGFPSYASGLSALPYALLGLAYLLAGIGIYATATLLYLVLFGVAAGAERSI